MRGWSEQPLQASASPPVSRAPWLHPRAWAQEPAGWPSTAHRRVAPAWTRPGRTEAREPQAGGHAGTRLVTEPPAGLGGTSTRARGSLEGPARDERDGKLQARLGVLVRYSGHCSCPRSGATGRGHGLLTCSQLSPRLGWGCRGARDGHSPAPVCRSGRHRARRGPGADLTWLRPPSPASLPKAVYALRSPPLPGGEKARWELPCRRARAARSRHSISAHQVGFGGTLVSPSGWGTSRGLDTVPR